MPAGAPRLVEPSAVVLEQRERLVRREVLELHEHVRPARVDGVHELGEDVVVRVAFEARRLPRAPLLALCADARYFPGMRRRAGPHSAKAGWKQKYDRVLSDVPCSGVRW